MRQLEQNQHMPAGINFELLFAYKPVDASYLVNYFVTLDGQRRGKGDQEHA